MSLRAFFYHINKAARFSNLDDASTLEILGYHLDVRAATWYLSLEDSGKSPQSMEDLRREMFKAFVPSVEKSQAKMDLVALEMSLKDYTDKHIDKLE